MANAQECGKGRDSDAAAINRRASAFSKRSSGRHSFLTSNFSESNALAREEEEVLKKELAKYQERVAALVAKKSLETSVVLESDQISRTKRPAPISAKPIASKSEVARGDADGDISSSRPQSNTTHIPEETTTLNEGHAKSHAVNGIVRSNDVPVRASVSALSRLKGGAQNGPTPGPIPPTAPTGLVRKEVERILKEHGIGRTIGNSGGEAMDGNSAEDNGTFEPETLSALRYELVKMQQELLRRNILDGKHYSAMSVDTLFPLRAKEQATVTLANHISDRALVDISTKSSLSRLAVMSRLAPDAPDRHETRIRLLETPGLFCNGDRGVIEVVLLSNRQTDTITIAGEVQVVTSSRDSDSVQESGSKMRHTVAYTIADGLLINRLTGSTMDRIEEASTERRAEILHPFVEQIRLKMGEKVSPKGCFVLPADRVLLRENVLFEGVARNVLIERDVNRSGLVITCTPLPPPLSYSTYGSDVSTDSTQHSLESGGFGSTILFLPDVELRVLLVNQRGLFEMAVSRWDSMVTVSRWLCTRMTLKSKNRNRNEVTSASAHTHAHKYLQNGPTRSCVTGESSLRKIIKNNGNISNFLAEQQIVGNTATSTLGLPNIENHQNKGNSIKKVFITSFPSIIESSLSREVEIPGEAKRQWIGRNVPCLRSTTVEISSHQDLRMLVFGIKLTVPPPLPHETEVKGLLNYTDCDEEQEQEHQEEAHQHQHQHTLTPSSESESESESEHAWTLDPPHTEIPLTYQLTDSELYIFGSTNTSTSISENGNANLYGRVKMSRNSETEQSATFFWNVLSRLHVLFKVSAHCSILGTLLESRTEWRR